MTDRYPIPAGECHAELNERRSRFRATLGHAPDPEAARSFIRRVSAGFPDATHNCWAFVAGPPGSTAQVGAGDDGEPQGTAGRPMLKVLLHGGVGEVAAVVTRYFGGVKLGTGGLVRAYSGAVKLALERLPVREKVTLLRRRVVLAYAAVEPFRRLAALQECTILEEHFGADALFLVALPRDRLTSFTQALLQMTNGEVLIDPDGIGPGN